MMKKIILMIVALIMGVFGVSSPVTAASPVEVFGTETNILTDCGSKSNGEDQIWCVINLVINILSVGVGILGVVGISVAGIQYLTAGGSEEKTRKAKRRMFEIVLGLAAYVVIYALAQWLLPTFGN